MKLFAPCDSGISIKFHFTADKSYREPRMGGRAPEVIDERLNEEAEYFCTFPLSVEPELHGSLFINVPFEQYYKTMNKGMQHDDRMVVVVHEPLPRRKNNKWRSIFEPRRITFENPRSDFFVPGDAYSRIEDHKIGGRPYCIQEPEVPGSEQLFAQGYVHVLQVAFPGPEDARMKGSWPFMDGIFNIIARSPFGRGEFYWCLQK